MAKVNYKEKISVAPVIIEVVVLEWSEVRVF